MKTKLFAALIAAPMFTVAGQTPDPSGHWEGSIDVPNAPISVAVDLAKNAKGVFIATFTSNDTKGLPLSNVVVNGKVVRLQLNVGPANSGTFDGSLSDDGKTYAGSYNTMQGGYTIPFSLKRTGDAKIDLPAPSPRISSALEGTWNGTLDVGGSPHRLVLTLANQADGTSSGALRSLDGSAPGTDFPVTIAQKGDSVTIVVKTITGSFAGVLKPDGSQLAGTWTQGGAVLPLSFKHEPRS